MKISTISIKNFRGIKNLTVNIDPKLTVFAGVNGSGKTTVLEASVILLSWIIARVRSKQGSGRNIVKNDIHNQAKYAVLQIATTQTQLNWQLVKGHKGYSTPPIRTALENLTHYANSLNQQITETKDQCNIPIFVYYSVNRAVLKTSLRIKNTPFNLLDAWDDALVSGVTFNHFFQWFRNREDLENEQYRLGKSTDLHSPDPQLQAVRQALNKLLPEFKNFTVKRSPFLRMVVEKNDKQMHVEQLSDGEKIFIALVGDIARRLAIANPLAKNPLTGEGIVLIDEIDLHFHPAWQRGALPQLIATFPNCQFIVSTHSPQVLGEVKPQHIRLLTETPDNGISYLVPERAIGLTSNDVLDLLMQTTSNITLARNIEIQKALNKLFWHIEDEQFDEARKLYDDLKIQLHGTVDVDSISQLIPELIEAHTMLYMLTSGEEHDSD